MKPKCWKYITLGHWYKPKITKYQKTKILRHYIFADTPADKMGHKALIRARNGDVVNQKLIRAVYDNTFATIPLTPTEPYDIILNEK